MFAATCPNREELFDYVVGRLSDAASGSVAEHLESCAQCQAGLATFDDADDTLVGRLRSPAAEDPYLEESQCDVAIDRARAVAGRSVSGSLLAEELGEYRLLQELGHGGMGTVYKALQTKLDRVVALKVLPEGRMEDDRAIARFEREMKAIGRLDHPNIVRAYDAREIDGKPVLVMQYVEGLDLGKLVRRLGPLPAADACELARQAALGLQYAHENGLVHRDIKPSNLMLTPQGEVKLLDLGLARFHREQVPGEEMTGTGQAMGTADYMAPEQASDSRTVDIRADIYSLGCTLYKLLSGRAPFAGPEYQGTFEKMTAHVQQPVPSIRRFHPEIPDELVTVLDRMLAKDPDERFATPAEVAEALKPFCIDCDLAGLAARAAERESADSSDAVLAPAPSGGQPGAAASPSTQRAGRRWKLVAAAVGLMLLSVGFGLAMGVIITIKRNGQTTRLNVPDGSQVDITPDGQVAVTLPDGPKKPAVSPSAAIAEAEAIQGRWGVVSVKIGEGAGFQGGDGSLGFLLVVPRIAIGDHSFTFFFAEGTSSSPSSSYPYAVNPAKTPNVINLYASQTPHGLDHLYLVGIYELSGDQLKLCFAQHVPKILADQQPSDFAIGPGSRCALLVLRRLPDSTTPSDKEAIQGTWEIVSYAQEPVPTRLLRFLGPYVGYPGDGYPEGEVTGAQIRKTSKVVITKDTMRIQGKHLLTMANRYQINSRMD